MIHQTPPFPQTSFLICVFLHSYLQTPSHPLVTLQSVYPSKCISNHLLTYCLSIHHLLIQPSTYPSINLPVHLSTIHLPICLPTHHPLAHSNHTSIFPWQVRFLSTRCELGPLLGTGKTEMTGVSTAQVLGNTRSSKLGTIDSFVAPHPLRRLGLLIFRARHRQQWGWVPTASPCMSQEAPSEHPHFGYHVVEAKVGMRT